MKYEELQVKYVYNQQQLAYLKNNNQLTKIIPLFDQYRLFFELEADYLKYVTINNRHIIFKQYQLLIKQYIQNSNTLITMIDECNASTLINYILTDMKQWVLNFIDIYTDYLQSCN